AVCRAAGARRGRDARRRGAALLLVLWAFMLLGVLAFDFGQYMRDDAQAAVNLAEETRGYYLAVAAMNRAIFDRQLVKALERQPQQLEQIDFGERMLVPIDGQWHPVELLGAEAEVRLTDLGAGIPLAIPLDPQEDDEAVGNAQALEVLLGEVIRNLLRGGNRTTGTSVKEEQAYAAITNAILDWLDPDDEVRKPGGAEAKDYARFDPPRTPKNGPLDSAEELLMVQGVDPDLFYGSPGRLGLRDVVSVFNPNAQVNLHHPSPEFLAVLFGIEVEEAEEVLALRGEENGWQLYVLRLQELAQAVGKGMFVNNNAVLQVGALDEEGEIDLGDDDANAEASVVLVEGRADTAQPRNQSRVAAVVMLEGLDGECDLSFCRAEVGEGVTVLRWFDRGPWSYEDMQPPPEAEDAVG
ncbi:MAG TPA: hypothetical protein VNO26_13130, partial [Candidatus Limnocylindria bacterium]|nr:hypothetical protein [Candidatus Limnocylindria bacterium]